MNVRTIAPARSSGRQTRFEKTNPIGWNWLSEKWLRRLLCVVLSRDS